VLRSLLRFFPGVGAAALSLLTLNAWVLMPTSLADTQDIILGVQCR
jgi:hypothetical protein